VTVRALLVALMLVYLHATPCAASLRDAIHVAFQNLGVNTRVVTTPLEQALAATVARSLPTIAASASSGFKWDDDLNTFVRTAGSTGQLLLERAIPIGGKRLNATVSYQYVKMSEFEGQDLENLSDTQKPIDGQFTVPHLGITLATHELTGSLTYGLTDDIDLNLTVPMLVTGLMVARQVNVRRPVTGLEFTRSSDSVSASSIGVGDILLRAKYRLPDWHDVLYAWGLNAALGIALRVPSGNPDDFQGTGDIGVIPMLYVTSRPYAPTDRMQLQWHVNAGADIDGTLSHSEGRWGVGMDALYSDWAALGVAVLGRHAVDRLFDEGQFNTPRFDANTGTVVVAPLFGFSGDRPDYYDASIGLRYTIFEGLNAFGNALFPLNDDGMRTDIVPLFGLEGTF
jgi:hypothetical protein